MTEVVYVVEWIESPSNRHIVGVWRDLTAAKARVDSSCPATKTCPIAWQDEKGGGARRNTREASLYITPYEVHGGESVVST